MRDATAVLSAHEFFDRARSRFGLASETVERFAQLLDAGACGLVLFDRRVVARKLRLGPTDSPARLGRSFVDEVNGVAKAVGAIAILFDFEQAVEGVFAFAW